MNTGPKSTSFKVHAAAFLSGLATMVVSFTHYLPPNQRATVTAVGGFVALGSTVAKLLHDKGIHVAEIQQAGSDVAAQLPALRQDYAKVQTFVDTEWPAAGARLAQVEADVKDEANRVVAAVPDPALIEPIVRQVLSKITAG